MILFLLPLVASLLVLAFNPKQKRFLKLFACVLSLIPLGMLLYHGNDWLGSRVDYLWFPSASIHFHLYIDSLSLVFLYLTAVIIPITLSAVPSNQLSFPHYFYALVLLLQSFLIVFFTARDLIAFTIFFEAMLFPLFFLITLWGGADRRNAAFKFLVYMIAGSVLMVASALSLYAASMSQVPDGTFDLDKLSEISSTLPHSFWLCGIFLLAFCVKTPLFPFHGWLPDSYCSASLPGSILLSAVLSKAGIYGILRIGGGLFPNQMLEWNPLLLALAFIGTFYGAIAAYSQTDFKRLIAYSSLSHVNFILAGLFIWNETAHQGAILQAVNHAITITALFLTAGWLEERIGTTSMLHTKGMARYLPRLCWITLFFVLSSIALPGLNNFIGEFLIFFGYFTEYSLQASCFAVIIILSAAYMLRWMQTVYFDSPSPEPKQKIDLTPKEFAFALPLIALTLWLGIYPAPALNEIKPAAEIAKIQNNQE